MRERVRATPARTFGADAPTPRAGRYMARTILLGPEVLIVANIILMVAIDQTLDRTANSPHKGP
jgi:hypothetical protein